MSLDAALFIFGVPFAISLFVGAIWVESERRTTALDAKIAAHRIRAAESGGARSVELPVEQPAPPPVTEQQAVDEALSALSTHGFEVVVFGRTGKAVRALRGLGRSRLVDKAAVQERMRRKSRPFARAKSIGIAGAKEAASSVALEPAPATHDAMT